MSKIPVRGADGVSYNIWAGSTTTHILLSSSGNNQDATNVSLAPTFLRRIIAQSTANNGCWLKIYDKNSVPSVADTPVLNIYLPPSAVPHSIPVELSLTFGLGYRITVNPANNDATNVAAGDVTGLNILYG